MEIKRVTVRNANLLLFADEFSEKFVGYAISSLRDFFSGYNQIELDEKSRALTTFMTFLGFMQITTLPQGATQLVAKFGRIILKILTLYL